MNRFGWFVRLLLNKVDSRSWVGEGEMGEVLKVTSKLCQLRKPQSASMYSLGLGLSFTLAGPRIMARIRGSSLRRLCPSRRRLMDDHPRRQCARHPSTCQDWRLGRPGGWRESDFNVLKRWVIPVWRRWCARERLHAAY